MQVYREREAFRKAGVKPVIVGHSSLRYGQAFVQETGIDLPVYVDPKREVYKALAFKRPLLSFLHPRTLRRAAEARKAGFSQPGVHGDPFQLGGVILRLPDGSIPYRYESRFAGDHPPIDELKAAANAAAKR